MPVICDGKVKFLDAGAVPVMAYGRFGQLARGERFDAAAAGPQDLAEPGSLLIVANFCEQEAPVGEQVRALLANGKWDVLVCAYDDAPVGDTLRPYEGVCYIRR